MILIVDDQPNNIFSLKSLLELHNFSVDTASSGEEALRKVLKNSYYLIILDVQMPEMDGFEVAEAISGYSKAKDTPIIFLSAISKEKKFITKGYTSGGTDYITKPIDPDILLLKVNTFYKLSEQTKELNRIQNSLKREVESRKRAQDELKSSNEQLEQKVKERTADLTLKNEELETKNHELQQFAWVASHDLKEPLRKIQTFNFLIKEKFLKDNDEASLIFNKSIKASERMSSLIDNLLNYSLISASSLFQPTDLNEVLNEILSDLEVSISEKKASIQIGKMPLVDTIPSQIRQVFQNLISNALKFSKKDVAPVVNVTADLVNEKSMDSPVAKDGKYCRIHVEDNGIGFDEKFLDKIFVIFQRLHTRDAYEGTGIGLAITKKIIDKHNGFISAASKVNEGSVFTIIIPVKQLNNNN